MYKNLTTLLRAAAIFSLLCPFLGFSNDGSDITISGESPRHGIGSSLYKASSRDGDVTSCTWSITDVVKDDPTFTGALAEIEKHGEDCYLKFNDFGSVILRCTAAVDIKGSIKHQSGSKRIECKMIPPTTTPTLSITGESVVTLNSEHEYIAEYSTPKIASNITWTYPVNQTHTDEKVTIGFTDLGSFRLNCELGYTVEGQQQEPVRKHKDIRVLPRVELTAMRASYENSNVANIPGEGIVKIHYNIDDDDESYEENKPKKGADCLQKAFKEGNTNPDDDLCKLEISFGNDVNINDLTEGILHIEITKGLRLWTNNMRPDEDAIFLGKINTDGQMELSVALSLAVPEDKAKVRDILNPQKGLYVEGIAHGYGCIKIRFADKKLKLPYQCYAVGGPEEQPDKTTRAYYKGKFPGLVDCEWTVMSLGDSSDLEKFNCVAYAVDPQRVAFNDDSQYVNPFNGSFWVNSVGLMLGYDSQSNPKNIKEPFHIYVYIPKSLWQNLPQNVQIDIGNNPYIWSILDDDLYFEGYKPDFLEGIRMAKMLDTNKKLRFVEDYLISMNLFRNDNGNDFNPSYVEGFFTWSKWGLQKCDEDDENRKVVYYHGNGDPLVFYHAARAVKYDPFCKELGKNADPAWKVVVSKCAKKKELLIHPEKQVKNLYGDVKKAFK